MLRNRQHLLHGAQLYEARTPRIHAGELSHGHDGAAHGRVGTLRLAVSTSTITGGDLRFKKPARSVLVPAGRVLVGDVPLHFAGVDSLHDTLAVVPSQTASRANSLAGLEVRKAVAGSLVKSAPVARGLDAAVVLPLIEKLGLDGLEPGLDLLELGLGR